MLFLIIIPCVLCFVYAWRRRRRYLQGILPPTCRHSQPFIGLAHLWMRGTYWNRLLDIQLDCLEQGCVTLLYTGINPRYSYYAICDPEDSQKVADSCLNKSYLLEDSIKEILGEGLATAPVPIWETHRRFIENAFEELCKTSEELNGHSAFLVQELRANVGKGGFDLNVYTRRAVMRILCTTMLGLNAAKEDFPNNVNLCLSGIEKLTHDMYLRHKNIFMHKELIYNCSRLKRRQTNEINVLNDFVKEIVKTKKASFNAEPPSNPEQKEKEIPKFSLAGYLLQLEAAEVYDEEEVVKELTTMLFSGYETMATTLFCVLYLMGCYPEVQENANVELRNVLSGEPDAEDLKKLVYLEAVVLEALRLYTPVTMVARVVNEEVKLKKYTVEAGSKCLLGLYAINQHATWGEDKDKFRPERWLDNITTKDRVVAFGIGKRSCVAKQFSHLCIMKILVRLLKEFEITVVKSDMNLKVEQKMFLTPETGNFIALNAKRV